VVRAIRRGNVAHDIGYGPHAVHVDGRGVVHIGAALHEHADLTLVAHGLLGRPRVTGSTVPGKSTISRTGTMMSASGGIGACAGAPLAVLSGVASSRWASATERSCLLQRDQQTPMAARTAHRFVTAGGKAHAALEPALREL
jgi:hypothetical protein